MEEMELNSINGKENYSAKNSPEPDMPISLQLQARNHDYLLQINN